MQSSSQLQRWPADTVSGSESHSPRATESVHPVHGPRHRGPGFSLNDLHTTLKNTQWSHWHLDSSRFGAHCYKNTAADGAKLSESHAGFWPTSERLTRATNRKAGRAASGGASWKFTVKSLKVVTGEEAHSEGFITAP